MKITTKVLPTHSQHRSRLTHKFLGLAIFTVLVFYAGRLYQDYQAFRAFSNALGWPR